MVFFTCNACGSSLKKNQVEKHYQTECPNCQVLSCMDCGKDFYGDEYANHTKCISEAEKYQGSMFSESARGPGKGERKQQAWLEVIVLSLQYISVQERHPSLTLKLSADISATVFFKVRVKWDIRHRKLTLEEPKGKGRARHVRQATSGSSVSPRVAGLLEKIADYPNVPRKKAKFENFVRNSFNVRDAKTLGQLWSVFDGAGKASSTSKTSSDEPATDTAPVCSAPDEETNPKQEETSKQKEDKDKAEDELTGVAASVEEVCKPKKKKKAKRKREEEEEDREADQAGVTKDHSRVEEPVSENEVKKTKKKKRSHRVDTVDSGPTEVAVVSPADSDVLVNGTSAEDLSKRDEESVGAKKKKRRHNGCNGESVGEVSVNKKTKLEDPSVEDDDCPRIKHKKKHKHKKKDPEIIC